MSGGVRRSLISRKHFNQASNVRCGSAIVTAPRRNGPPIRGDHAERRALIDRMKAAAAKTPATQGGVTE